MHLISDPWLAKARALKIELDKGHITQEGYTHLYAALARAAEADRVRCRLCEGTAYIGGLCSEHALQERAHGT